MGENFGATWVIISECCGKGQNAEHWFAELKKKIRGLPKDKIDPFLADELGLPATRYTHEDSVLEVFQVIEEFRDLLDSAENNMNVKFIPHKGDMIVIGGGTFHSCSGEDPNEEFTTISRMAKMLESLEVS